MRVNNSCYRVDHSPTYEINQSRLSPIISRTSFGEMRATRNHSVHPSMTYKAKKKPEEIIQLLERQRDKKVRWDRVRDNIKNNTQTHAKHLMESMRKQLENELKNRYVTACYVLVMCLLCHCIYEP